MTRTARQTRLADPGTLLATTHKVDGGLGVGLRLARTGDARRVGQFLNGLSAEALYGRFLAALAEVPEALTTHFTFFDPRQRLVIVATAMPGGSGEILGLADVALPDTGVAELALVVDEARQGMGVGKLLTEVAASLAMRQGAAHMRAELPQRDGAMLHLMERLGRTTRSVDGDATILLTKLPVSGRRAA